LAFDHRTGLIGTDRPSRVEELTMTAPQDEFAQVARQGQEAITAAIWTWTENFHTGSADLDGVGAARNISRAPSVGVLTLTTLDHDSVFAATHAGARGYLLQTGLKEIIRGIHAVARGVRQSSDQVSPDACAGS
jgi:DNA-binding NarL/FixJ family response regulator